MPDSLLYLGEYDKRQDITNLLNSRKKCNQFEVDSDMSISPPPPSLPASRNNNQTIGMTGLSMSTETYSKDSLSKPN